MGKGNVGVNSCTNYVSLLATHGFSRFKFLEFSSKNRDAVVLLFERLRLAFALLDVLRKFVQRDGALIQSLDTLQPLTLLIHEVNKVFFQLVCPGIFFVNSRVQVFNFL